MTPMTKKYATWVVIQLDSSTAHLTLQLAAHGVVAMRISTSSPPPMGKSMQQPLHWNSCLCSKVIAISKHMMSSRSAEPISSQGGRYFRWKGNRVATTVESRVDVRLTGKHVHRRTPGAARSC
eukprot:1894911-Amphidinium_carterae.1